MSEVVKFSPEMLKRKEIYEVYQAESYILRSLRRLKPQTHEGLMQKVQERGIDQQAGLIGFIELLDEGRILMDIERIQVFPTPVRRTR